MNFDNVSLTSGQVNSFRVAPELGSVKQPLREQDLRLADVVSATGEKVLTTSRAPQCQSTVSTCLTSSTSEKPRFIGCNTIVRRSDRMPGTSQGEEKKRQRPPQEAREPQKPSAAVETELREPPGKKVVQECVAATARTQTETQLTYPAPQRSDTELEPEPDLQALSKDELVELAWYSLLPTNPDDEFFSDEVLKQIMASARGREVASLQQKFPQGEVLYQKKTKEIPLLAVPNDAALALIARRYKAKYGIDICVVEIDDFPRLIQEIEKKYTRTTFVGVVVGTGQCSLTGHVGPMVVFVNPPQPTQFLLMDVLGDTDSSLSFLVQDHLRERGDDVVRCYGGEARQEDYGSCRVGALILLRNALLSFKDSTNSLVYWQTVFANGKQSLPPEWTYLEQLQPLPISERPDLVAVRDKFSSKAEKRAQPKTVAQKREEKTEVITVKERIRFTIDRCFLGQKTIGADKITVIESPNKPQVVFDFILPLIQKPTRTYLARRGHKEQKRWVLEVLRSFGIESTILFPELFARLVWAVAPPERRNQLVVKLLGNQKNVTSERVLIKALKARFPFLN